MGLANTVGLWTKELINWWLLRVTKIWDLNTSDTREYERNKKVLSHSLTYSPIFPFLLSSHCECKPNWITSTYIMSTPYCNLRIMNYLLDYWWTLLIRSFYLHSWTIMYHDNDLPWRCHGARPSDTCHHREGMAAQGSSRHTLRSPVRHDYPTSSLHNCKGKHNLLHLYSPTDTTHTVQKNK